MFLFSACSTGIPFLAFALLPLALTIAVVFIRCYPKRSRAGELGLKMRFHPSAELKIEMLSTSIGSCRRGRR